MFPRGDCTGNYRTAIFGTTNKKIAVFTYALEPFEVHLDDLTYSQLFGVLLLHFIWECINKALFANEKFDLASSLNSLNTGHKTWNNR